MFWLVSGIVCFGTQYFVELMFDYLWSFLVFYCTKVMIFGGEVTFIYHHTICPTPPVSLVIQLLTTSGTFNAICFSSSSVARRNPGEWEMVC